MNGDSSLDPRASLTDRLREVEVSERALAYDMDMRPEDTANWRFADTCRAAIAAIAELSAPIPLIMHCPVCHVQHVDEAKPEAEWHNPPHKSHLCLACGAIFRPCDRETSGVATIATSGRADTIRFRDDRPLLPDGARLAPGQPLVAIALDSALERLINELKNACQLFLGTDFSFTVHQGDRHLLCREELTEIIDAVCRRHGIAIASVHTYR